METYFFEIDRNIERLEKATGLVWGHTPTGGGCDSYTMDINGDSFFMVTHNATAPILFHEWENITLTFHNELMNPVTIDRVSTFAELVDYFIDGNPHAEEVPYYDCPVCETMAEEWDSNGCSCWLCRVCNTTNHEGDNECRSCRTNFCTDCGCIITPTDDPENEWAGNHNPACHWGE